MRTFEDTRLLELLVAVLALWRVTHLFTAEDGPWALLARFRTFVGNGFWGQLLDCFYCLSLWLSLPFAYLLASGWVERVLLWLALSGGAVLLEQATDQAGLPDFEEFMPESDNSDQDIGNDDHRLGNASRD